MSKAQLVVDVINIILIVSQLVVLAIYVPEAIRIFRRMDRHRNYNVVKDEKSWLEKIKNKVGGFITKH